MPWHKSNHQNEALMRRLMPLIDLTSLNANDTEATLVLLFEKAQNQYGHVASVCVMPDFVRLARIQFQNKPVRVGTVVNFPHGLSSIDTVLIEINDAIEKGAQEIDMVFPYTDYLSGDRASSITFVKACKASCGHQAILKVILETGVLKEKAFIESVSVDAIMAGADFIKTSTGKMGVGATMDAAEVMLSVIKRLTPNIKRTIGFKVSGGIREIKDATAYVELADKIMGQNWVGPGTFRIGASQLVDRLLEG